jgi:hypothetical protein
MPAVLKADLIGFHTYDYARHFVSACTRILGLEGTPAGEVAQRGRRCPLTARWLASLDAMALGRPGLDAAGHFPFHPTHAHTLFACTHSLAHPPSIKP